MNFEELAENSGFEKNEFLELMELFFETGFSDLKKLKSAIDEENSVEVVNAAHSIKGAAGSFEFHEIYEVAKEIEMKARQNSLEGVDEDFRALKENFNLNNKLYTIKLQESKD